MPTYEYICDACGHEFEATQRIVEPPIRTCTKCAQDAVTRKISRPAFILKGGGWYADGYSKSSDRATKSATATEAAK